VLLHKSIIDYKWWERNWRQAHTAEIILPITNLFGSKLNICSLYVIEACRNVLYLHILRLIRIKLDDVIF
jgi:hypothetical protein